MLISRLSYCASVCGGTYSYLLDQIDRVQIKARFFGIIDEIEPICKIIRKSDQAGLATQNKRDRVSASAVSSPTTQNRLCRGYAATQIRWSYEDYIGKTTFPVFSLREF